MRIPSASVQDDGNEAAQNANGSGERHQYRVVAQQNFGGFHHAIKLQPLRRRNFSAAANQTSMNKPLYLQLKNFRRGKHSS
jgi:hypothetical protein